ncbi:MAG: branched-chain amino acid ABC transporter permease [Polyangiales bacterium]
MLRKIIGSLLVVALLAGVQRVAGAFLDHYFIRVLSVCGINVMLAVSLNLVNGTTGQFSIGHAGFMAVGAYASAIASFNLAPVLGPSMSAVTLVLACVAGIVAAALAGVAVGVPSLRLRGDYLAIVTLGFGEIIRISIESTERLGGSQGYPLGAASIPPYATLAWVWGGAVLGTVLVWNLTYSSYGRALSAIREDEIAAEAAGIPTTRYKVLAFSVSAALTGLAGAMYAHDETGGQHIDPGAFRMDRSVDMLVMIIFGGLGSITGAIIGGVFVAVSLELLREFQSYRLIAYALLLIGMMLLRPQGLLGTREFSPALLKRLLRRGSKAVSP